MKDLLNIKVAIVCDSLDQYGGAEKIVEELHALFPLAPIYTSVFNKEKIERLGFPIQDKTIITPTIFPEWLLKKFGKMLFFLYPLAFESFDFSSFDLVISSSSRFAHGVITSSECVHICYMHAPARYAWDYFSYRDSLHLPVGLRQIYPFIVSKMRVWDRIAADRVDYFIANSSYIQKRIAKFYRKNSVVINPFVDIDKFLKTPSQNGEQYLYLGRIIPIRKLDILIDAFNESGKKLHIVGNGSSSYVAALKAKAKENISFYERQTNDEVRLHLAHAKALLWPGIEDFGMASIEAQAAGVPVIAFRQGGSLDTIQEGVTGIFFDDQTKESILNAITYFETLVLDTKACKENAKRFNKQHFDELVLTYITQCLHESRNRL